MRQIINLLFVFAILLSGYTYGQSATSKKIYNKDFKWTITIPENFEKVSEAHWSTLQNDGKTALETTLGEKIENKSTSIFVFKSGQFNYFESNYQPYDPEIDGDYSESNKMINQIAYMTLKEQMPNRTIDTVSTFEKIDGLVFHVFKMKAALPLNNFYNMHMYSRLFDKKEFAVNILYLNEEKGKQMLTAWRNSTFLKKVPKPAMRKKK